MSAYEQEVKAEIIEWKRKMTKHSGLMRRLSKRFQSKANQFIPEKIHAMITESVKKIIQTTLVGARYATKKRNTAHLTLEETDREVLRKLNYYKKTASAEGAGTGAGGILLGLADFPLLLGIKMKFLFDT